MRVRFAINDDGWSNWSPATASFQNDHIKITPSASPWSEGVQLDDVEIDFEHDVYWTLQDGDYYLVQLGWKNNNELGTRLEERT